MPLSRRCNSPSVSTLAIMCTKGLSVTAGVSSSIVCNTAAESRPAACAARLRQGGVHHPWDAAQGVRRYAYRNTVKVVDLGLRIGDVAGLETEDVFIDNKEKATENLVENGATPEEVAFLLEQRVELNAFPSDQLISWLEAKLVQHGVAKVIPDEDVLAGAFRRMHREAVVQERIDALVAELEDDKDLVVPANLKDLIRTKQVDARALPWDQVLRTIVKEDEQ